MSVWKIVVSGSTKDLKDDYGFSVQQAPGTGMAPVENLHSEFAEIDGCYYHGNRTQSRTFSLIGALSGSSLSDLHTKRKNLLNAIFSRDTTPSGPTIIKYDGGACTLQASCYYSAGLEFGKFNRAYEVGISLKFYQPDSMWEKIDTASQSLIGSVTIACANRVLKYTDITGWTSLGPCSIQDNSVYTVATTQSGSNVYAGGQFTIAGSSTTACYIAKWNGNDWSGLSASGVVATAIYDIEPDLDDTSIYVGGIFTKAGSLTVSNIAKWNGSQWSIMTSSGINNTVTCIHVSRNTGLVYVGGTFTKAGSVTCNGATVWDGNTFFAMTSSGLNGLVNCWTEGKDGTIYAGGTFTQAGSVAASRIAKWDPSASQWDRVSSCDFNGGLNRLEVAPNGDLYAMGAFTKASDYSIDNAARWNGTVWEDLGGGVWGYSACPAIRGAEFVGDELYVGGFINTAGCKPLTDKGAVWNGSEWTSLPVDLPGNATVYDIYSNGNDLILGYDTGGTARTAASTVVVVNNGTNKTWPIITACAASSISFLRNVTTGQTIYFADLVQNDNEVLTLDLTPGQKTFTSSIRGNLSGYIQPTSQLSDFCLIPGTNTIFFYCSGINASAKMTYIERYWSLDN